MKKKLLKPPLNNDEVFVFPDTKEILPSIEEKTKIGVAHQPYFFNPGVSLKFLFLESLPHGNKRMLFLDTDKVNIVVSVPSREGLVYREIFINDDRVLYNFPTPAQRRLRDFFSSVEKTLGNTTYSKSILGNLLIFKEIILDQRSRFLREVLAESFLKFYKIETEYLFVSDVIKSEEFKEFFRRIYQRDSAFREIFNTALDDYRKEYRFRYKSFPFPRLEEDELPFWVVKDGLRVRCFKRDIDVADFEKLLIFPRASSLTIFLRLFELDLFIHGVGGVNYEWVNNRVIEKFFKKNPPRYAVISGTFLINDLKGREFPYFFYSPQRIRGSLGGIV